jgi:predicted ATP-grasp superfamily ATP-dependent carboligase
MLPPEDLYELTDQAPALGAGSPDAAPGPVLVHALDGFVDAGRAGSLAAQSLLVELEAREVARFDADQLVDYRSRRPRMTFRTDRFTDVAAHELVMYALTDAEGRLFYLLTGPEPDLQWERFCAAVRQVVERLGVRLVVGVHAIPWAAPHTRPVGLTPHASDRELIAGRPRWIGDLEVPGSVGALLELRLAEAGHATVGFAAHVPHYLSTAEYPPAAVALLDAVAQTAGLSVPTERLKDAGVAVMAQIEAQVESSPETQEAVRGLERSYDAAADGRTLAGPGLSSPTLPDEEMPGGDELAAELEQYLRSVDDEKA